MLKTFARGMQILIDLTVLSVAFWLAFALRFDSINGIMYSANWDAGLWALKVVDP